MDKRGRREVARYVQLAENFRRHIAQGEWPVGMRLPTVAALAAAYQVARITVRQAMDILDKEKLVARSPGRGMYVIDRPVQVRWHNLRADWDEFLRSTTGVSAVLKKSRDATIPEEDGAPNEIDGPFSFLRILGTRNTVPVSIRDLYVSTRLYETILLRLKDELIMAILADYAQDIQIFNEIRAATPQQAEGLKIAPGTPILAGRHVGLDTNGKLLFLDYPILRGDYVNFQIKLSKTDNHPPRETQK